MKKLKLDKWIHGALPALLLHVCIGSVYCWSLIKGDIASAMNVSVQAIEFAFSLAIFFLGMSAALGGRLVEKNVKRSSIVACSFFSSGLLLSALFVYLGMPFGFIISYGCLMGIGLGFGYLSPVKTLMLWFSRHKGLATGIAISGFGLSKVIFSPYIQWCTATFGIYATLITMACFGFIFMLLASYLIKKPDSHEESKNGLNLSQIKRIIFNPVYIKIWLIFFLNITCGLALISFEKDLAVASGIMNVGLLASLTAVFNTLGRFGYSSVSDLMRHKEKIYLIIFGSSAIAAICGMFYGVAYIPLVVMTLCIINAGYGGGFSTLPNLLNSKFGMDKISTIHGFSLSAWAWAGICGNQMTNLIINVFGGTFYQLYIVLAVLYAISFLITLSLFNEAKIK